MIETLHLMTAHALSEMREYRELRAEGKHDQADELLEDLVVLLEGLALFVEQRF